MATQRPSVGPFLSPQEHHDWQDALRVEFQPSLERLYDVARQMSGQSHHARRILLAIYNPDEWPLEISRLRALDHDLQLDALSVIRWFVFSDRELHHFIMDGAAKMNQIWELER